LKFPISPNSLLDLLKLLAMMEETNVRNVAIDALIKVGEKLK